MPKTTPRLLRTWFGILAFLYAIIVAGRAARVILLLRAHPHAQLPRVYVADALFVMLVAIGFGWVTVRFSQLIVDRADTIKAIVHANYWGSIVFGVLFFLSGTHPNFFGLLVSTIIYVYLVNAVTRVSLDASAANAEPAASDQVL